MTLESMASRAVPGYICLVLLSNDTNAMSENVGPANVRR